MPVVGGASVAISPDLAGFRTKLATEMDAILASLNPAVHVDVDATGFAGLKAKLDAIGETHIRPDVKVEGADRAIAEIGAVKAAEADARKTSEGGIMGRLLWGAGGGALGLATFGSLGSLAGFDVLHALTLGGSLAASAGAGLLGGGLLAAGSLGTAAVGMGTNLAGIGQAAGDIRATETAMTALNQAVMLYGKNSLQAAQAQDQVNLALAQFNPVARGAVQSAAVAIQGFKTMFDQYTGYAEKTGAQIIQQLVQTGEKFLPTIGAYATANMQTIQQGLQPFLAWLTSMRGGLGIFDQLEAKFRGQLPTAIHALEQGFEVFAHTIAFASERTGAFLVKLDEFLTRVNTPSGLAKWHDEVNRLINDFEMWWNLIKALIRDVYALFHQDAGTASSIVVTLTQMLNSLHQWIVGVGAPLIHSIFTVHKQEILALLALLPPLLAGLFDVYIKVGPPLARLTTDLLGVALAVVKFVGNMVTAKGPMADFVRPIGDLVVGLGALLLVLGKLGALGPIFSGFQALVQRVLLSLQGGFKVAGESVSASTGAMAKSIQGEGLALIELRNQGAITAEQFSSSMTAIQARLTTLGVEGTAAITGLEGSMAGLATTTDAAGVEIVASADATATGVDVALGSTGVGLVIVGIGIAITELAAHWKQVWDFIKKTVEDAANWCVDHINQIRHSLGFLGPILADLILGIQAFATHWKSALNDVLVGLKNIAFDIGVALATGWNFAVKATAIGIEAIVGFINKLPGYLDQIVKWIEDPFYTGLNWVSKGWGVLENVVIAFVNNIPRWLDDVITAIEGPFETALNWVSVAFGTVENVAIGAANNIIKAFESVGKSIINLFDPIARAGAGVLGFFLGGGRQKAIDDLLKSLKEVMQFQIPTVTPSGMGFGPTPTGPFSRQGQLLTPGTPAGMGLQPTGPFGDKTLGIDMKAFDAEVQAVAKALHVTTPAFKSITDGMTWLTNKEWDVIHAHGQHKKAVDDDTVALIHHARTTLTQISAISKSAAVPTFQSFAAWQAAMQALDTQITDQATAAATIRQDQMALLTSQVQGQQTVQNLQMTAATDLINAADTIRSDVAQMATDATNAVVQHMGDVAQMHSDATQAQTTRIADATTIQSDQTNAVVTAIQDQTQVTVDRMAEFNRSGISLQIAQATVALDQLKATQDSKDALFQIQADQLKARGDVAEARAQAHIDSVTLTQDAKVALAQQKLDSATVKQAQLVDLAQQNLDTVNVVQAQKVAAAQNNANLQALKAEQVLSRAQAHVDQVATTSNAKALVVAQNQLANAQAAATHANSIAAGQLTTAQNNQAAAVGSATRALTNAQNTQSSVVSKLGASLSTTQNDRSVALQTAQGHLQSTKDGNAAAQQKLAQQIATSDNHAKVAEAQRKRQIDILSAIQSQQGQGTVIHLNVGATADPLEAAAAVAFRLKVAGVY